MRRGDVDDPPPAALLHPGNHRLGGIEGRREVEVDDRLPFLVREILDRRDELDAGIVDQHIDRAEGVHGAADQFRDTGGRHQVGAVIAGTDTEIGLDRLADRFDLVLGLDAVQHHVHSRPGEAAGNAEADA